MEHENLTASPHSSLLKVCQALNLDPDTSQLAQTFLKQVWGVSELQVDAAQKSYKAGSNCLYGSVCFIAAKASTFKTLEGQTSHGIGIGIYQAIKSSFEAKP